MGTIYYQLIYYSVTQHGNVKPTEYCQHNDTTHISPASADHCARL